jgi:hypothetical protein
MQVVAVGAVCIGAPSRLPPAGTTTIMYAQKVCVTTPLRKRNGNRQHKRLPVLPLSSDRRKLYAAVAGTLPVKLFQRHLLFLVGANGTTFNGGNPSPYITRYLRFR